MKRRAASGRSSPTAGRCLPADAEPWWYGYSVGKWDGDTLVVETTGFRDDVWLDIDGSPLTNTGKMTERFRRPNFGTLEIEVTVEDPTGLHQAVHRQSESPHHAGYRFDRIHLYGKRSGGPHLVGK